MYVLYCMYLHILTVQDDTAVRTRAAEERSTGRNSRVTVRSAAVRDIKQKTAPTQAIIMIKGSATGVTK
jgi:hypothetical protein